MLWLNDPRTKLSRGIALLNFDLNSEVPQTENTFLQNPEYPHSQDARDLWWERLQNWGNDPNYGAISPDWNNIWETVQRQIKQYYEGGPLSPGAKDRARASLARRNMSENPASDFLLARLDAEQGNTLADASTQQAIQKQNLSEAGRRTWLDSLTNFQAQRPAGEWQTKVAQPSPWWDVISSGVGAAVGAATGNYFGAVQAPTGIPKEPTSFAPINHLSYGGTAWG